jgi:hypothetical protein
VSGHAALAEGGVSMGAWGRAAQLSTDHAGGWRIHMREPARGHCQEPVHTDASAMVDSVRLFSLPRKHASLAHTSLCLNVRVSH